jgi:hypothetical protein
MYRANSNSDGDRVQRHTSAEAAEAINEKTRSNVRYYAAQPRLTVDRRIEELDREWDVEQVLETNAGVLALTGAVLGTAVDRKFFALTALVLGFLAQHATTGWCPPVPVFRAMGVRTRNEIDQEKYALKALRGDFRAVRREITRPDAKRVLEAVRW